ncbi:glycosyltransferase family 4 protein [Cellvibrio fontiphilus]|uniref:Glycosyltransferase family 4 protein n=1 Tax=Cellvibrio fontiphilus TaxID=1815559 RepID=A0ABV7FFJ5_9GAMM
MKVFAAPAFSNEKVNPYNALLYRELQQLGVTLEEYRHSKALRHAADVAHFHWPDGDINRPSLLKSLQRMLLLALAVSVIKMRGTKVVWTVHNTAPHDARRPRLSQIFMQWFARRCDGFIFMSEANRSAFYSRYQPSRSASSAIIPHGHYRNAYPPAVDAAQAKKTLGLNPQKKVLLFVGMIKPYKNIDGLMQAFDEAKLENYQLVIAGTADSAPADLQARLQAVNKPNTHVFLRFIPDEELALLMSAADVVILPYKAILNSGALLLALSYNRPIIAPHRGAVAELQKILGEEWIQTYDSELSPPVLALGLTALEQSTRPPVCPLDIFDWDKLAAKTLEFYCQLHDLPNTAASSRITGASKL